MDAIAGKTRDGEYWFKSDQYLTNLTGAIHFYVRPPSYILFWRRRYALMVKFDEPYQAYNYTKREMEKKHKYAYKVLGLYRTEALASLALEEVMKVLGMKPLEST